MSHLAICGDAATVLPTLTDERVDAIVIDPPYDEGEGAFFSYTDRRRTAWAPWLTGILTQARQAWPDAPVAVSIGHTRVFDLARILTEVWPDRAVTMVTVDSGTRPSSGGVIHRAEYLLIAMPPGRPLGCAGFTKGAVRTGWGGAVLSGHDAVTSPRQVFPIWVDPADGRIVRIGELSDDYDYTPDEEGLIPLWPVTRHGKRAAWRLARDSAVRALEEGWIRADRPHMPGQEQPYVVKYLAGGVRKRIEAGEIRTHGRDDRGALIIDHVPPVGDAIPTIWSGPRYESEAGTRRLRDLLGEQAHFPYPKPVGLVEDAIRAITGGAKDAHVLDFFAGSGTLLDAVVSLNAADGGDRRAIMVTADEGQIFDEVLVPRALALGAETDFLRFC